MIGYHLERRGLKWNVQGQGGEKILDVDGQGGWRVLKIGQYVYHPLVILIVNFYRDCSLYHTLLNGNAFQLFQVCHFYLIVT